MWAHWIIYINYGVALLKSIYWFHVSNTSSPLILQEGFPLAEFIMACGFFTVLILEKMVLSCTEGHRNEETAPLLAPAGHGHAHGQNSLNDLEGSSHHVHVDFHAHSSFRSFMLFLSLSLHSVFEGLAIGLQTTDTKVIYWILFCLTRQLLCWVTVLTLLEIW